jgi:hypothetical protein
MNTMTFDKERLSITALDAAPLRRNRLAAALQEGISAASAQPWAETELLQPCTKLPARSELNAGIAVQGLFSIPKSTSIFESAAENGHCSAPVSMKGCGGDQNCNWSLPGSSEIQQIIAASS